MKTYSDYTEGRKRYVDRSHLNMAYGGDPMPPWEELSDEEQNRWEKRAESVDES